MTDIEKWAEHYEFVLEMEVARDAKKAWDAIKSDIYNFADAMQYCEHEELRDKESYVRWRVAYSVGKYRMRLEEYKDSPLASENWRQFCETWYRCSGTPSHEKMREHLWSHYRNATKRHNEVLQAKGADGFIYCLVAKDASLCKIGYATKRNGDRTKTIHSHCPYDLELYMVTEAQGGMRMEKQIHKALKQLGQHFNREWFIWSDVTRQYLDSL